MPLQQIPVDINAEARRIGQLRASGDDCDAAAERVGLTDVEKRNMAFAVHRIRRPRDRGDMAAGGVAEMV